MAGIEKDRAAEVQIRASSIADSGALITVSGELDVSNAEQLKSAVQDLKVDDRTRLVFDLSALRYMDSAGIAVLLDAAAKAGSVHLRNPSTAVRRVIELTGLSDMLPSEP